MFRLYGIVCTNAQSITNLQVDQRRLGSNLEETDRVSTVFGIFGNSLLRAIAHEKKCSKMVINGSDG